MARTIETTVYQYDELSDEAKAKARECWRELVFTLSTDYERIYNDAARVAYLLGIELFLRHHRKLDGTNADDGISIYFSGFSSQGDGASFDGDYRYSAGMVKAVMKYAPKDKTLHIIARRLQWVQKRNFYQLQATCKLTGPYEHSGCMTIDVSRADDKTVSEDDESEVIDVMRQFADWIYEQLRKEYDYQCEDDVIANNIRANEYEFYKNGKKV